MLRINTRKNSAYLQQKTNIWLKKLAKMPSLTLPRLHFASFFLLALFSHIFPLYLPLFCLLFSFFSPFCSPSAHFTSHFTPFCSELQHIYPELAPFCTVLRIFYPATSLIISRPGIHPHALSTKSPQKNPPRCFAPERTWHLRHATKVMHPSPHRSWK